MNIEEVFELIHQNGIGQNIECFFSSENVKKGNDFMSKIDNYKYRNNEINVKMDRNNFLEHEKNLANSKNCELLIKQKEKGSIIAIILYCKFLEIKNQHINARIFRIKYPDSGKEIIYKVQLSG